MKIKLNERELEFPDDAPLWIRRIALASMADDRGVVSKAALIEAYLRTRWETYQFKWNKEHEHDAGDWIAMHMEWPEADRAFSMMEKWCRLRFELINGLERP